MTIESPDLRVTVRRGRVRIIDWAPWLVTDGPMWTLVEARGRAGVAIADISVVRDEHVKAVEAVAAFLAGDTPDARHALTDWARDVGYRRLWLPDEVIELPGPTEGLAEVRCTGCGARLADGHPRFWAHVHASGRFPTACPLCGCDLPQWRVRQNNGTDDDPTTMPDTDARTRCT